MESVLSERFDSLEWTKVTVSTSSCNIEEISALLFDLGICSTEIIDPMERNAFFADSSSNWDYVDDALLLSEDAPVNDECSIVFYLGTDSDSLNLLSCVKTALSVQQCNLKETSIYTETVNDHLWLNEWKKHFHPIRIGRILIIPEWEAPCSKGDADIVFTINPGSAFGTGQHATTALCIEALQDALRPEDIILDIGCGSGILAITGLLLGAKSAIGCDIDPASIETTKMNAALNPIDLNSLHVFTGDIFSSTELHDIIYRNRYNVIVANIVADVVIQLAPMILSLLNPRSIFIASGIIYERLNDVLVALYRNNLKAVEIKAKDGWCCVTAHG